LIYHLELNILYHHIFSPYIEEEHVSTLRLDVFAPARVQASLIYSQYMETIIRTMMGIIHTFDYCVFKVINISRAVRLLQIFATVPAIKISIYANERYDVLQAREPNYECKGHRAKIPP
jgi:hypothetical protein